MQPAERMGAWLCSGNIVSEYALQLAVSAHSNFSVPSERVFLGACGQINGIERDLDYESDYVVETTKDGDLHETKCDF